MTDKEATYWRRYARVTAHGLGIRGDDLEDVAQDCLLDCIKAWDRMSGAREAYLGRVVRNRCLSWLDRESLRRHDELTDEVIDGRNPTSNQMDAAADAMAYVTELDEVDARVVRLLAEGHTDREIAKLLGCRQPELMGRVASLRAAANRVYGQPCLVIYKSWPTQSGG